MHRSRTRVTAVALAAVLLASLLAITSIKPSGALPGTNSSCKASEQAGAEIGMFPASNASQSNLRASCILESDVDFPGGGGYPAGTAVASAFTIHDFDVSLFHNGAARAVTSTGATALGASTIQIGAANGATLTTWVNRAITGPGIAPRTFVTAITAGGAVSLSEVTNLAAGAGSTYRIDNAAGSRSIDTGTLSDVAGVTHLTTAAGVGNTGNFTLADVGLSVTTSRIPGPGCTVSAFNNVNDVSLSCSYNGSPAVFNGNIVTIGGTMIVSSHRRVDDAISGAVNTATRVSTVAGRNEASDVGLRVYGTGLDADTTVASVSGAGNIHLNLACAALPCNVNAPSAPIPNLRIGDDTGTAVEDNDAVVDLGAMLDLSPGFVAGSQACSAEEPEGFHIIGVHRSPDNFDTVAFGNAIPSGVRVLSQLHFDNATGQDFAGYIVHRGPAAAGDPHLAEHFDVVFPLLPVTIATCAQDPDGAGPLLTTDYDAPGVATSVNVFGQTVGQSVLPTGVGRPGTAQHRAVKDGAGYASTAYMESNTGGITWTPLANFNRTCIYPATAVVNFVCGNG